MKPRLRSKSRSASFLTLQRARAKSAVAQRSSSTARTAAAASTRPAQSRTSFARAPPRLLIRPRAIPILATPATSTSSRATCGQRAFATLCLCMGLTRNRVRPRAADRARRCRQSRTGVRPFLCMSTSAARTALRPSLQPSERRPRVAAGVAAEARLRSSTRRVEIPGPSNIVSP